MKTLIVLLIVLVTCFTFFSVTTREDILLEEFGLYNMKGPLPSSNADFKTIDNFLILTEKQNLQRGVGEEKLFTIGVDYKYLSREYRHVINVEGINPVTDYMKVRNLYNYFLSDTTFLDCMQKESNGKIRAVVYRKANKNNVPNLDYMHWRTEEVVFVDNRIKSTIIERVNQHLF